MPGIGAPRQVPAAWARCRHCVRRRRSCRTGLARIADDQWNSRTEIADCGIALTPGFVLEELHAMVRIDDDDRVARPAARLEMAQRPADLVIELCDAAVVEVDDLIEVEFFARRALPTDDLEGVGQSRHRELGFTVIVRGRQNACTTATPTQTADASSSRRRSARTAAGSRQARKQAARAPAHLGGQRDATEVVQLRQ